MRRKMKAAAAVAAVTAAFLMYFVIGCAEYDEVYVCSDITWGYVDTAGTFFEKDTLHVIDAIWDGWYVSLYAVTHLAAVAQVLVPKNGDALDNDSLYANIYSIDEYGNCIAGLPPVRLPLYKAGERNDQFVFQTRTLTQGKKIVFVRDPTYHNWDNEWAYVISAQTSCFELTDIGY